MIEAKFKIGEDQYQIMGKTKDDFAKMIRYVVEKRIGPTLFSRGKALTDEPIFEINTDNYKSN